MTIILNYISDKLLPPFRLVLSGVSSFYFILGCLFVFPFLLSPCICFHLLNHMAMLLVFVGWPYTISVLWDSVVQAI